LNLRKLYHKNKHRDENIPQNINIYFVGKNVRKWEEDYFVRFVIFGWTPSMHDDHKHDYVGQHLYTCICA
jgi:hypothetical protein